MRVRLTHAVFDPSRTNGYRIPIDHQTFEIEVPEGKVRGWTVYPSMGDPGRHGWRTRVRCPVCGQELEIGQVIDAWTPRIKVWRFDSGRYYHLVTLLDE